MELHSTNSLEIKQMMANFLRDLNRNKGMTLEQIGDAFGCSRTMICYTINNLTHLHRTGKQTRSMSWLRFADGVKNLGYEMNVTLKRIDDADSD